MTKSHFLLAAVVVVLLFATIQCRHSENSMSVAQALRSLGFSSTQVKQYFSEKRSVLDSLQDYFRRGECADNIQDHGCRRTAQELYYAVKRYVSYLDRLQEKHFSEINNVIIGSNVNLRGSQNFISAKNVNIVGDSNFVTSKKDIVGLTGNDFVVVGRYKIILRNIESISYNPKIAIKVIA